MVGAGTLKLIFAAMEILGMRVETGLPSIHWPMGQREWQQGFAPVTDQNKTEISWLDGKRDCRSGVSVFANAFSN
jgi:hypothetical protein